MKVYCPICGCSDLLQILQGRVDKEFGFAVPGLKYYQCLRSLCRHVHAAPTPRDEVIRTLYKEYTTHEAYRPKGVGRLFAVHNNRKRVRQKKFLLDLCHGNTGIRILDYGCGNGILLKELADLGFTDLTGYDFDHKAVSVVRSLGFRCHSDPENIKPSTIEVIFLNHVLEHVPRPKQLISHLIELTTPGGIIYIRTPNGQSLLARICGANWRGWETPRHLNVFSCASLKSLLETVPGAKIIEIKTSNDLLLAMSVASLPTIINKSKIMKWGLAMILFVITSVFSKFFKDYGEEVVAVIRREK